MNRKNRTRWAWLLTGVFFLSLSAGLSLWKEPDKDVLLELPDKGMEEPDHPNHPEEDRGIGGEQEDNEDNIDEDDSWEIVPGTPSEADPEENRDSSEPDMSQEEEKGKAPGAHIDQHPGEIGAGSSASMEAEENEDAPAEDVQSETAAIVHNTVELKAALTSAVITEIYLGQDIAINETGLTINKAKSALTISGTHPDTGELFTLTEYNSSAETAAISLDSSGPLEGIVLRDIRIIGHNHFGTVRVPNSYQKITLTYIGVDYTGPQMIYNKYGTANLEDCVIRIGKSDTSPAGEVGEVAAANLFGRVTISQLHSQENEIFFLEYDLGDITVKSGAAVTVTTAGPSGFVYTTRSTSMIVESGASFSYTAPNRFWDGTPLTGLTVQNGGRMQIEITGTAGNTPLRVNGPVDVGQGAWLHVLARNSSGYPSMGVRGKLTIKDPESVLLYSSGNRTLWAIDQERDVEIIAQQVNCWYYAADGSLDAPPDYQWLMEETDLTITGTLSQGDSGNWSAISSNWDDEEAPGPNATTFNLRTARVVSIGRLQLSARLTAQHRVIGSTGDDAQLRLYYVTPEGDEGYASDSAPGGFYSIDVPQDASKHGLQVGAAWNYLYMRVWVEESEGTLTLESIPPNLAFHTTPVSGADQLIRRMDADWGFQVRDSRGAGNTWTLCVSQLGDFCSQSGDKLEGGLCFLSADGTCLPVGGPDSPTVVQTHTTGLDEEITPIVWEENQGILLMVYAGQGKANTDYTAIIQWSLVDAP